jgi:hypothetical protein
LSTASAKPTPSLKEAIRILKESTHETATGDIWLDYKALEALQILEAQLSTERTALTGTEMMLILSDVYDGGKSMGIKFTKDPMLMVGQLFNILERNGIRFIRIDGQERAGAKTD